MDAARTGPIHERTAERNRSITPEPQPEPISFSLGTLFLIVSCIGVALVAFRIHGRADFGTRTAFAAIFVSAFLTVWFLATLQFDRFRLSGSGGDPVSSVLSAFSFYLATPVESKVLRPPGVQCAERNPEAKSALHCSATIMTTAAFRRRTWRTPTESRSQSAGEYSDPAVPGSSRPLAKTIRMR